MQPVRNFSFHGEPIDSELSASYLVLIDPRARDGLSADVQLNHLRLTAKALTWDRYDAFLRSQVGDNSIWIDRMEEVGGRFFGMLNGDVSTSFRGDGSYPLKPNTPHPVNR